jgi:hypothetical protein
MTDAFHVRPLLHNVSSNHNECLEILALAQHESFVFLEVRHCQLIENKLLLVVGILVVMSRELSQDLMTDH